MVGRGRYVQAEKKRVKTGTKKTVSPTQIKKVY